MLEFIKNEFDGYNVMADDLMIGTLVDVDEENDWWYSQAMTGWMLTTDALKEILNKIEELNASL